MRLLLIIVAVFSLSACTKVAFKTDKQLALKVGTITDGVSDGISDGDSHNGGGSTPDGGKPPVYTGGGTATTGGGQNPTTGATNTGVGSEGGSVTPGTTMVDDSIPVNRHCSDAKSIALGVNVHAASTLKLNIYKNGSLVCSNTNTAALRPELKAGYFSFCSSLSSGTYQVDIIADGTSSLIVGASGNSPHNSFTFNGSSVSSDVQIVMDSNPNKAMELGTLPQHDASYVCDSSASPLYVDFRRDSSDTDFLSAPNNGVMFDILGANGTPAYHKSQISWFEKGKFALLTLPNSNGSVLNIDQLFGNNTLGDDDDFADNGFMALAKYDSNHDQVIDAQDAVYSQLRLWFDVDRDAKAEQRELKSLAQMQIVAIDLDYDPNYAERDKYGNEVKLKSVVKFSSGKLKPIFDLWFALGE